MVATGITKLIFFISSLDYSKSRLSEVQLSECLCGTLENRIMNIFFDEVSHLLHSV